MMTNPKSITFKVAGDDKEWLQARAAQQGGSVGQLLRKLVIEERQRCKVQQEMLLGAGLPMKDERQIDLEELTGRN